VACRWLFSKDQTLLVRNSLGISCAQKLHIGKWLVVPGLNYTWKITYIPYPMSEKGRERIKISDFPEWTPRERSHARRNDRTPAGKMIGGTHRHTMGIFLCQKSANFTRALKKKFINIFTWSWTSYGISFDQFVGSVIVHQEVNKERLRCKSMANCHHEVVYLFPRTSRYFPCI
jgi:hypothetical protein